MGVVGMPLPQSLFLAGTFPECSIPLPNLLLLLPSLVT